MKNIINEFMPLFAIKVIKKIRFNLVLLLLMIEDYRRYSYSAFGNPLNNSFENLKGKITLYGHAIEKGLSHEEPRPGFGKYALNQLIVSLENYETRGYSTREIRYEIGIDIIKSYIEYHNKIKYDIQEIELRFQKLSKSINSNITKCGGAKEVDFKKNDDVTLDRRFSIRNFSEKKVDIELLERTIERAKLCPSACNRQPWKVYVIRNVEIIEAVLKLQGGLNSYGENLSTLLLITIDNSYYGDAIERNAGYIDGGIFTMEILNGLYEEGLASCVLNGSFENRIDKKIRKVLSISRTENFIAFIAVGHNPEKTIVPISYRDSISDFTVTID